MGSIVYPQFVGSWVLLVLLGLLFFPFAFLYWAEKTIWVVDPNERPAEFVEKFRANQGG